MYRILTENINQPGIRSILNEFKVDFTLYEEIGSWNGEEERFLAIELDALWDEDEVKKIARRIKSLNKQEAILLQNIPVESEFV